MSNDLRSVTVMLKVEDTARADVMLSPTRTYYRFVTDSSIEDGELAAVANLEAVAAELNAAVEGHEGETPLSADVKLQLFINNRVVDCHPTEGSLKRTVEILVPLAPEFAFLRGFVN